MGNGGSGGISLSASLFARLARSRSLASLLCLALLLLVPSCYAPRATCNPWQSPGPTTWQCLVRSATEIYCERARASDRAREVRAASCRSQRPLPLLLPLQVSAVWACASRSCSNAMPASRCWASIFRSRTLKPSTTRPSSRTSRRSRSTCVRRVASASPPRSPKPRPLPIWYAHRRATRACASYTRRCSAASATCMRQSSLEQANAHTHARRARTCTIHHSSAAAHGGPRESLPLTSCVAHYVYIADSIVWHMADMDLGRYADWHRPTVVRPLQAVASARANRTPLATCLYHHHHAPPPSPITESLIGWCCHSRWY